MSLAPFGRAGGLAIAALALAVSGCADPLGPEQGELVRERARWEGRSLQDYRYEYERDCFCPPLHGLVEVRGGRVAAVTDLRTGEPEPPEELDRYPTVEALFDTLAAWIGREPHAMQVAYDDELGYPRSAFFDFEVKVADEEQGFRASDLQPIADPPLGISLPPVIVG